MKIVHVFKDYYPPLAAGITGYIADVACGLAERGHDVEVHVAGVTSSRRDRLQDRVIVHRHRELGRILSMPMAPGLAREVATLKADVIHLHMPNPIGELPFLRSRPSKLVCTFHAQLGRQQILEPFYRRLRDHVLNQAAVVFVAGPTMAQAAELRGARGKIVEVPYGVSPRMVARHTPPKSSETSDCLRLIFVGRLVYYKGLDVLLRSLARVEGVNLRIVGDGIERESLYLLVQTLGLEGRVSFAGVVSDARLVEEYQAADVIVLPSVSRAEAFGLAMVEGMANGLPAVSTSLGTETDNVNVAGITGLVVPPKDVPALAQAIERLKEPRLRTKLAAAAIAHATQHFSFESHLDRLEEGYLGY